MNVDSITRKEPLSTNLDDHTDGPPPPPTQAGEPQYPQTPVCLPNPRMQSQPVTLYAGSISPGDIKQLGCGDCILMASLACLARTPEGQARIRSMIHANPDGSWNVTLNGRGALPVYLPMSIRVTPADIDHDGARAADGKTIAWPRVIEAAMWKLNGQRTFDQVADVARMLGLRSESISPKQRDFKDKLVDGFKAHKVQVVLTGEAVDADLQLAANHTYAVTNVKVDAKGAVSVELLNPWGTGSQWMTLEQVQSHFGGYTEASSVSR